VKLLILCIFGDGERLQPGHRRAGGGGFVAVGAMRWTLKEMYGVTRGSVRTGDWTELSHVRNQAMNSSNMPITIATSDLEVRRRLNNGQMVYCSV
jgi:hypothetical protein